MLAGLALLLAGCGQKKADLSPPAPPPMPPGVTWGPPEGSSSTPPAPAPTPRIATVAPAEAPTSVAPARPAHRSGHDGEIETSEGEWVPLSPPTGDPEPPNLIDHYNSMLRVGRVWQTGIASFYGPREQGRSTASGEVFDYNKMTAASRLLPMGTIVKVTDLKTGRSVNVRINDRGPFWPDRILDLSLGAARVIGVYPVGLDAVSIRIVSLPDPVPPGRYTVQVGWFNNDDALNQCSQRMKERMPRQYDQIKDPVEKQHSDEGHWLVYDQRVSLDIDTAESIATDLRDHHFPAYVVRLN